MRIALTTPTGNIGGETARLLSAADVELALLVRDPNKLDATLRAHADVRTGDLNDADFVRIATEGADALLWVAPPGYEAEDMRERIVRLSENAARAVETNCIGHVVYISSAGAQLDGAGPVTLSRITEERLTATGANVLLLRCGFFMENYLQQAGLIAQGFFSLPAPGNVGYPQVATRDIAAVAARRLFTRDWQGSHILGVHGPADLTFDESAAILSDALGRPIRYVESSDEQARAGFLAAGLTPEFAASYVQLFRRLVQSDAVAEPRTSETTTPTTLFQWASEVLKPALQTA